MERLDIDFQLMQIMIIDVISGVMAELVINLSAPVANGLPSEKAKLDETTQ